MLRRRPARHVRVRRTTGITSVQFKAMFSRKELVLATHLLRFDTKLLLQALPPA
jgi:hypothetical protein